MTRRFLSCIGVASALRMSAQGAPRKSVYYDAFLDKLPSLTSKTFAVTGASRGLGFATAKALARKGARVCLLNRGSERSAAAVEAIAAVATGEPPFAVECDLLDFGSVRDAAAAVRAAVPALDGLCLNAGVMMAPDEASFDGYDVTASTNVLSHFILARDLLPALDAAGAGARIVSMSSGSGFGAPAFDARYLERRGGDLGGGRAAYERYHQSKLANLLFASTLAERLAVAGSAVASLACTPGVCGTDMYVRVASLGGRPADLGAVPSVEDGCLAQLKCLADPTVASGELWGPAGAGGPPVEVALAPPTVLVDDAAKRDLWDACERAVGPFPIPNAPS